MSDIKIAKVNLYLEYYKYNNIIDKYATVIDRLVIDNDWIEILKNPNEKLYITPLNKTLNNKINSKIAEYEEILDSPIIKEDYKLEVQHIIRVLKELKGDN